LTVLAAEVPVKLFMLNKYLTVLLKQTL